MWIWNLWSGSLRGTVRGQREAPTIPDPSVGAIRLVLRLTLLVGLTTAGGCFQKDAYVPPDLLYLFASYQVGKNPTSVTTADFNQDGFTDLITTNIGNNSLSVLLGNGDGTFKDQVQIEAAREPRALALNDYNGDGRVDVAVACSGRLSPSFRCWRQSS